MTANAIIQRSGDLDAFLALLPETPPKDRPVVRVVVRTFFGTLELYSARPDVRWGEGPKAILSFGRCNTLTGDVERDWTLVRLGPDPDAVVFWMVVPMGEGRALEGVQTSFVERWKSISVNGHDISHFSDEHDEHTVYPPGTSATTKRPPHAHLTRVK